MKKIIVFAIISVLATVLLVGCKSKEVIEKPPVSSAKLMAPTVVGEVLEVKEDGRKILVNSTEGNAKGEIWVSIDDKTNFFENISEGTSIPYKNVSRKFVPGNHVEIFIEGGVMESAPMQGTASAVYVNETKK
jgi:hypothetical protein